MVKSIFEWIILSASDDTYSADVVVESLKEMALRLPEPARGVVNYIVCPPYTHLSDVVKIARGTASPLGERLLLPFLRLDRSPVGDLDEKIFHD